MLFVEYLRHYRKQWQDKCQMLYLYSSNSDFDLVVNFTPLILLLAMEWPGWWEVWAWRATDWACRVHQLLKALSWVRQNVAKVWFISLYMRGLQHLWQNPGSIFYFTAEAVSQGVNFHWKTVGLQFSNCVRQNYLEGLLKYSGWTSLQNFWDSRFGVGLENLHF